MIEAFAKVLPEHPNIHLLIIGTGPDEIKLKERATNLGIEEHSFFYGEASWETVSHAFRGARSLPTLDEIEHPSRWLERVA